jgi:hypothetical protein
MQIELENKYLHIQGFVSPETLGQMAGNITQQQGTYWFFVEYAPATYSKGATFHIIIDDAGKKMIPEFYNMRLLEIVDQFGYHQPEISEGWKTICQFAIDSLPPVMTTLPELKTWKHNPNGVKFVNLSDITVQDENAFTKKIYMLVLDDIISWAMHADPANRKEFAHSFRNIINAHKDEMQEKASPDFIRKVEDTLCSI